ncbi:MAG: hypothetical protein KBI01_07835 [Oscillospiraceae bacterium]|nr:hypothetical protein [Oscillospiraceae bacterium]
MKMNYKPAFRYQFSSFLKGSAVIYLILIVVVTGVLIGTMSISKDSASTISITGFSITATIYLFVMGIVEIRNDLRLCLQCGVSRRTAFLSELTAVLAASAILAVAGELLTGIAQALAISNFNLFVADLYQLIFVGSDVSSLTFSQHVLSALFNTSLMFAACVGGMFFSLMFWRLNRLWTIVVAISIPVLLNLVPNLLHWLNVDLTPFVNWISSSIGCFLLFFLVLALLLGVFNWLLLRRANIREAK